MTAGMGTVHCTKNRIAALAAICIFDGLDLSRVGYGVEFTHSLPGPTNTLALCWHSAHNLEAGEERKISKKRQKERRKLTQSVKDRKVEKFPI